ncbi:MAG TPA: carboxypeptidase regulatory-like domain-containing protein [Terriglobales bacterium]|nr:carboxypeptidase regulatory-like domain-containing protein [Terriglobales bacterium]
MNQGVTGSKLWVLALVLIAAVSMIAVGAYGQAISGDLVGTVFDKSGAVIPNATVTAVNVATNVKTTTTTTASGEYRFGNLLVGKYDMTVSATGFTSTALRGLPIELNKTATANITLEIGQVATTVEVSGAAPLIDTTTAQVETSYEAKQLQDLPAASTGLGVINLSLLQAGVASSGGLGAGTGPSIGGQRPRNNNFTVEGVDNNDKGVTGPLIQVPNDAVSNFSILENQFSPEFGHSTGGQFNQIVNSGTNTFHGRLYEYLQNKNFNAVDTSLSNQGVFKNPRYDNNRFGGQVGGPIFKDKLFFFVNYEQNPIGQAATPGSPLLGPTSAGYATLLGVPGVSNTNVTELQRYVQAPAACTAADIAAGICPTGGTLSVGGTPIQVGILPVVAPNWQNYKYLTTSMDYNISDKDQLRGRYIYNNAQFIDTAAALPIFYTPIPYKYHLVALSEYHQFTAMMNNELRLGYNRVANNWGVPDMKFPGLDAFPNLTIDNLGGINVGPSPNNPQYATQNLYQLMDNLSWVKGNHTLKFGIEGRKYISPQLFIQRSRGDYEWSTLAGYALDQVPDGIAQRSVGSVGYNGDQYGIFWYVNDIWKVRPNFSLNLGVRYEYTSTPYGWTQQKMNAIANVPGLITFDSPRAPKADFMPRVGFAWSPGTIGNTSVRGGFGMGYDVLYDNIGTLSRPPQIGSTIDCTGGGPPCSSTAFLANGGIPPGGGTGITILDQATARAWTSSYLPNDVKYPYSLQWNLGVQHVFAKDYTAEVRYVGTRGVHLNTQNIINYVDMVTPTNSVPTYLQVPSQTVIDSLPIAVRENAATGPNKSGDVPGTMFWNYMNAQGGAGLNLNPIYYNAGFTSPITGFMPWGASTYHGMQTQLSRRMANGLQFQAAYTWSHAIDDSTADFFSTIVSPRRPQNFQDIHAERSNSPLDHRHRFTLATIYDMPFFAKHSNWFVRNFLGNYEFAPVFTYETGGWGTVQSGRDTNLNGDSAPDRAIFNPAGVPGTGSDVTPLLTSAASPLGPNFVVGYVADNPNAQYISAGYGTLSTSSRNTLHMNPINNWDMTLLKRIAITERYRFEFAAQLFNAFNHAQWVPGSVNTVSVISRTGQGERNYFIPTASNFNVAKASWPSNARSMQFYLKFIF